MTPGKYKMICYYTNWSWYRQGEGKYAPSDIDTDLCTHIIYGFATLDPNQLIMRVFDSWCDTDEYGPKLYAKVTALKSKGIKVLIALGGWNDSLGNKYSRMVNDPSARKRFVDNAIDFIEKHGFDGLDLDWEYPKCWQVIFDLKSESLLQLEIEIGPTGGLRRRARIGQARVRRSRQGAEGGVRPARVAPVRGRLAVQDGHRRRLRRAIHLARP